MNQKLIEETQKRETLRRGGFYWVRVASLAPVSPSRPAPSWQPARYTGRTADSVGETWDFIGLRSEDGHHFADVIEVGAEIVR